MIAAKPFDYPYDGRLRPAATALLVIDLQHPAGRQPADGGLSAGRDQRRLSQAGIVAFATHGLVPGELNGLTQPALALSSPTVTGDSGDGLLTMEEILGLKLDADWPVPVRAPNPGKPRQSARNFLGFRDGSANPDSTDAELMKRIVWVQPGGDEPAWTAGGSYQVVRLIRNFVERWDRTPLQEQQAIIGRQKASGAPLEGGTSEADVPHFANDPLGKTTPLDAHIRLANPRDAEAQKHLILRRPFNYSNGVSKSNQMDMGLLFICYQADLEQGFVAVQTRLSGEALEEYIKPFGGGYFFALPGVKD
eukprot:gene127-180_t